MTTNRYLTLAAIGAAATLAVLSMAGCRPKPAAAPAGPIPRQGKLEEPLIDHMARVTTNTLISVVVVLQRQVREAEKRLLFRTITESNRVQRMKKQRQALALELSGVARSTQRPLLRYLQGLETNGSVREVRSIWLSNVIGVQAPAAVIHHLASSNEVAYIHLDLPRHVIHGTPTGVPWGLTKIKIPTLEPEAIKQQVIVAVLDTGVDYKHADLAGHLWINSKEDLNGDGWMTSSVDVNHKDDDGNGYVDDVLGWNFSGNGSNNPEDVHGHGTHVAGIIVGDGTDGTRTGVAPHARIMTLRESSTLGRSTEQECWLAMQYALTNHAHIINFSSGWRDDAKPDYASWRYKVQNLTDSGVLFVTAAGDSGTDTWQPYSVTTPGRVPAALAVGSSTQGDDIPPHSCQGPVTWEGIDPFRDYPYPPGLMKPDLAAPGQMISSTRIGGGYMNMDGTSMAAPHVAGVAALLLAKNPDLHPYDVRFILEETANNIYGPDQPDPGSGWGRLDAEQALATTSIDPTPYDLSVADLRVDKPPEPNKPALFFARVQNLGGQVLGNVELRFYFADGQQRTVTDLTPNEDGVPDKTKFSYIGSYFVPILGPKIFGGNPSKHATAEGVVRWTIPTPPSIRWWIGAWVLPGPVSGPESNPMNNGALIPLQPAGTF